MTDDYVNIVSFPVTFPPTENEAFIDFNTVTDSNLANEKIEHFSAVINSPAEWVSLRKSTATVYILEQQDEEQQDEEQDDEQQDEEQDEEQQDEEQDEVEQDEVEQDEVEQDEKRQGG